MARKSKSDTRDRILSAAEVLFARRGFEATSVRDIFKAADVGTGLMAYYFASKEELFRECVERHIPDVKHAFREQFPRAETGETISVERLLHFYFHFFLVHLPDQTNGLASYWNLLSRCASSYDEHIVSSSFAELDFIAEEMTAALQASLPRCSEERIRMCLAFAEAAVTTLNSSEGLLEHRLGGEFSIDQYVTAISQMLASGLR